MCINFTFGSSPIWAQTARPGARFKMHRSNMSCQIRFSSCLVVAIFAIIKDSSVFAIPMDIKGLFCLTGVVALGTRKLYTFLIISLLLAHFDIVYLKKSLSHFYFYLILVEHKFPQLVEYLHPHGGNLGITRSAYMMSLGPKLPCAAGSLEIL